MNNNEISILMMDNMNNFHNFIKVINSERYKKEKCLTERQFFALSNIRKHRKIELKNLSKDLHVSNSSLCILLNKLVEQNYVYREEDSGDRRNTFYGITESGEAILDKEINNFVSIVNERIEHLDEEDREKMSTSLSDLKSIITKLF